MDTQLKLLDIALTLPENERAVLAASLIRSLDDAPDPKADVEWAAEIERRIRDIDEGSVQVEAWDDVMNKMRERRNALKCCLDTI